MANGRDRSLTELELAILEDALTNQQSYSDLAEQYGVQPLFIQNMFHNKGVRVPGLNVTNPLDETERQIYMEALRNGWNIFHIAEEYGFEPDEVLTRLQEAGLTMPMGEREYGIYIQARNEGLTAEQVAEQWNEPLDVVQGILDSAGLSLSGRPIKGREPKDDAGTGDAGTGDLGGTPGAGIDAPTMPGGDLGTGGMYAPIQINMPEMPSFSNMFGAIPQLPGLRMVRRQARRQSNPNWRGTTDTILTSGQGLTTPANTAINTLLGS